MIYKYSPPPPPNVIDAGYATDQEVVSVWSVQILDRCSILFSTLLNTSQVD